MTLIELLRRHGNTTDPIMEAKIIEEWFTENDFEDVGLAMITRLSSNKLAKVQKQLDFARSWIPNKVDLNINEEFANNKATADILNRITTYCMLSMELPTEILEWAKEYIPKMNVPKIFFMPAAKYLKERYGIEFKNKPQWNFWGQE